MFSVKPIEHLSNISGSAIHLLCLAHYVKHLRSCIDLKHHIFRIYLAHSHPEHAVLKKELKLFEAALNATSRCLYAYAWSLRLPVISSLLGHSLTARQGITVRRAEKGKSV